MHIVDANMLIQYIVREDTEQYQTAKQIIENTVTEVLVEVLSEVVYVLSRQYGYSRLDVSGTLYNLLTNTKCEILRRAAVMKGIELYGQKNLDFVDCILAGYSIVEHATICTFDKKLKKLIIAENS
ncbi:MAG: PIN domain-containing protein [Oscillospiraceae bacterium]|jgi:predicted nucleic-acid-binding protein|nr:PIN domain-containing protein [Oscillospiraceae bacterium]